MSSTTRKETQTTTGRPVHRFTSKKSVIAPLAVMATVLASVAVGLPSAQATNGRNAVFGTWQPSGYTQAQTDPNLPDDPDGQAGEENLANHIKIGERFEVQVPGTESHELSEWAPTAPQGAGWVRLPGADGEKWVQDEPAYDETVVDKAAWTETIPGKWWNWSPNHSQGPQDYTPAFPSDSRGTWQGPHTQGGPDGEGTFDASHGSSGNSSWFHRDAAQVIEHPAKTHVVHHDAVAHQEFRYERQGTTPGHTEYYWAVYERTNTQTEPGVEEPTDPSDPSDPSDPAQPSKPDVSNAASGPSKSNQPNRPAAHSRAVPVSIDAGL